MLCSGTFSLRSRSRCFLCVTGHTDVFCLQLFVTSHKHFPLNSSAGTRSCAASASINQKELKENPNPLFFFLSQSAELLLVPTDGEAVNSFEQQLSDAPDHLRVSVRLPAAQSPGPCPPTGTVLALRSVCLAAQHSERKDALTSGWSAYRGPESLTRSAPAPRSSPKCAVRRGAARLSCVTGNTGGSGAHHTGLMGV